MIRTLRRIWSQLLGSVMGRHGEADLAEEVETHVRMLADENRRRGIPDVLWNSRA